jgi:hypothetical protein
MTNIFQMSKPLAAALGGLLALVAAPAVAGVAAAPIAETRVQVTLPPGWADDASGRLLLFAEPATAQNAADTEIDSAAFRPKPVSVAARDVASFGTGRAVLIDTQETAYPAGFASLPPGDYRLQAVLDRDGNYNYGGRGAGDLVSKIVTIHWPSATPATVALDHAIPATPIHRPAESQALVDAATPHLHELQFASPALTAFWGKPTRIGVWVLTPPNYDPAATTRWPTVYQTGGFGSSQASGPSTAARIWALEAAGQIPPMIWVFLDHASLGTGTTEFADSVNNGPWGRALTTELIPALERQYRMDAKPSGRLLTGHSSGGWAALWLQVAYPTLFGGSWPTAPDPSTFHDFTGADLYAPHANFYHDAASQPHWLIRDHAKRIATIEQFARLEAVLGRDGGQFRSFEWVFSPKGPDGGPEPMFDRATGAVDPAVVAYWRDHYDVAHILERDWTRLKPDLDGKIHLTVGTADTFFLDGAAHKLEAVMRRIGAKADFTYLPDKTHMDLYERGGDKQALTKDIARAMYAVARP